MQKGSLTTGDINSNYGGGTNWNTNTSGLLLECLNNTEIAIHDSGNRIASSMYYEGLNTNKITIGRDMGWGAISNVVINGNIIGSGTAFTNLNYNSVLNPPTLVSFNNPSTFVSTLNISRNTTLNNTTTIRSSLNVSGTTTLNNTNINGIGNIHNGLPLYKCTK